MNTDAEPLSAHGADPRAASPKAGDESGDAASSSAAVERLFREQHRTLLRFLMVQLRSEQEASEVAQEAYVRLLQLDTRQVQAVNHLPAFLYRAAENLAIDRLRTRKVAARALRTRFTEDSSRAATPENEVAAAEELALIEQCLRELPPKCRQAFFLSRFHGLSCPEIARHMHIAERTVRFYIVETVRYCRSRLDRLIVPAELSRSKD